MSTLPRLSFFNPPYQVLTSREFKVAGAIGPVSSLHKKSANVAETEIGQVRCSPLGRTVVASPALRLCGGTCDGPLASRSRCEKKKSFCFMEEKKLAAVLCAATISVGRKYGSL